MHENKRNRQQGGKKPGAKETSVLSAVGYRDFDPARAPEKSLLALHISREQVEQGKVGEIVDALMRLTDSEASVRAFAGRVTVMFGGYDEDPRELFEIPEVVSFFLAVHRNWGGAWYWFLVPDVDVFGLVLKMLCPPRRVQGVGRSEGRMLVEWEDIHSLVDVAQGLCAPVTALCAAHSLPMDEFAVADRRIRAVLAEFFGRLW